MDTPSSATLARLVVVLVLAVAADARADYSSYQWRKIDESRHAIVFIPPTPIWPEVVGEVQLTVAGRWLVRAGRSKGSG